MGGVQAADTSVLEEVIVNADKDKAYAGGYLSQNTSLGMLRNKDMMELPAATMTITDQSIKDFAISGNNEVMDILSLNPSIRRTTSPNAFYPGGRAASCNRRHTTSHGAAGRAAASIRE